MNITNDTVDSKHKPGYETNQKHLLLPTEWQITFFQYALIFGAVVS
jgi:hypothetical protein